MLQDNET